ncbi:hypothetical protein ROLI_009690 [Roseobacter fucihabitans]|uniref:Uncharacterized protein n=1 Tax=Roseobacter fucihabitans TaxID=1537242 RepID=A0ABZ2BPH1_9RHOB|nr:hypothetical protein [Roseobacter litoralis]MBC6966718.1 hypothetical protein [Roseobacter litoralis]
MVSELTSVAALWWAVIFSGLYHGLNPGMGWPLAVSAALMERSHRALPKALGLLALGHFLAMLAILLPFSLMFVLVEWEVEIRVGAGLLVIAMGLYLTINRRHPRILARIHPARLALWSFLAANAHGAGLMLVPLFLGLCGIDADTGHKAAADLMQGNILTAFTVAFVHSFAMTVAGGIIGAVIYFWLGLRFLSKTWFNLDLLWALSLIAVGAFGIYAALYGH